MIKVKDRAMQCEHGHESKCTHVALKEEWTAAWTLTMLCWISLGISDIHSVRKSKQHDKIYW